MKWRAINMKIIVMIICILLMNINASCCYAVRFDIRSEIYENRLAYSSNAYDIFITTNLVENELYDYYANKRIEMSVIKHVKSSAYTEYIKNVIREYYPSPIYYNDQIMSMIDKAKADNKLWIREDISMDFRNRTVSISNEALWTMDGRKEICFFNLTPEATFQEDYSYVDMDNSPESAAVANASIEFLESIKDIYFDDNKGKQIEQQRKTNSEFFSYWNRLKRNWVKVKFIYPPKKQEALNLVELYVDSSSLYRVNSKIEGWFKIKILSEHEAFKHNNEYSNELMYYASFDLINEKFYILAGKEIYYSGKTYEFVRTEPELWTSKESPFIAGNIIQTLKEISQ